MELSLIQFFEIFFDEFLDIFVLRLPTRYIKGCWWNRQMKAGELLGRSLIVCGSWRILQEASQNLIIFLKYECWTLLLRVINLIYVAISFISAREGQDKAKFSKWFLKRPLIVWFWEKKHRFITYYLMGTQLFKDMYAENNLWKIKIIYYASQQTSWFFFHRLGGKGNSSPAPFWKISGSIRET